MVQMCSVSTRSAVRLWVLQTIVDVEESAVAHASVGREDDAEVGWCDGLALFTEHPSNEAASARAAGAAGLPIGAAAAEAAEAAEACQSAESARGAAASDSAGATARQARQVAVDALQLVSTERAGPGESDADGEATCLTTRRASPAAAPSAAGSSSPHIGTDSSGKDSGPTAFATGSIQAIHACETSTRHCGSAAVPPNGWGLRATAIGGRHREGRGIRSWAVHLSRRPLNTSQVEGRRHSEEIDTGLRNHQASSIAPSGLGRVAAIAG